MKTSMVITSVVVFAVTASLLFASRPVQAVEDTYWVTIDMGGGVVEGGGSGYGDGEWYEYTPGTGWINQWFYNAPFDWDRWKLIHVTMDIVPYWPGAYAEVTVNWSTPEWSEQVPPPTGPPLPGVDEALYIIRMEPYLFEGDVSTTVHINVDNIIIPDYNPEWVSIDVRGYGFGIENGYIWHECIPEPGSMALIGIGLLALTRRKK